MLPPFGFSAAYFPLSVLFLMMLATCNDLEVNAPLALHWLTYFITRQLILSSITMISRDLSHLH